MLFIGKLVSSYGPISEKHACVDVLIPKIDETPS
jgi:hypothetical protein